MLLVADVGNSEVDFGAFEGSSLAHVWRADSQTPRDWGAQLQAWGVRLGSLESLVIGSVKPDVSRALEALCKASGTPSLVVTSTAGLLPMEVDDPAQVGVDRVVDCLAAWARKPVASCVIDFGTATTFNYLTAKGAFAGGMIAPGVKTALDALTARGAQLTNVPIEAPPAAIGKNTRHAMQSAIVYGYAALVDGLIAKMESEAGVRLHVVATGGLAKPIAPQVKRIDEVVDSLTLEGLRLAYEKL